LFRLYDTSLPPMTQLFTDESFIVVTATPWKDAGRWHRFGSGPTIFAAVTPWREMGRCQARLASYTSRTWRPQLTHTRRS